MAGAYGRRRRRPAGKDVSVEELKYDSIADLGFGSPAADGCAPAAPSAAAFEGMPPRLALHCLSDS